MRGGDVTTFLKTGNKINNLRYEKMYAVRYTSTMTRIKPCLCSANCKDVDTTFMVAYLFILNYYKVITLIQNVITLCLTFLFVDLWKLNI